MDAGARVAWKDRFNHDELSAVQHAMNLKLQNEVAFWAEYQNEPLPEIDVDAELITVDEIMAKTNGMNRAAVPIDCAHLTAFIDVQDKCLFYLVAAWEPNFTGYVIDYGTYPEQKSEYFTLREVRYTLAHAAPRAGFEGKLYAGLETLTDELLTKEWKRDDGAMMRIDRCPIDANWGKSTNVVYQFCRQSQHAAIVIPSHGRYVGAATQPFSEYKRKRGDRIGHNWRIPNVNGRRAVRHVLFDANAWKSFVHARLAVAMGDSGCLSLFGRRAERHRAIAEHMTAETPITTEGRGRTVDEWKLIDKTRDNHWFDCIVGAAVAASMQGASLLGEEVDKVKKRPKLKLSEIQKAKQ